MDRLVELESISFEEESSEVSLRPSIWDEYIGQEKIKKNLRVFIEASKKRDEALDHILFFGPPGFQIIPLMKNRPLIFIDSFMVAHLCIHLVAQPIIQI